MAEKPDTTNPSAQPIPAAGTAMPAFGHPNIADATADAALLAMQSTIDAANRELDAALDALAKAEDAYPDNMPRLTVTTRR